MGEQKLEAIVLPAGLGGLHSDLSSVSSLVQQLCVELESESRIRSMQKAEIGKMSKIIGSRFETTDGGWFGWARGTRRPRRRRGTHGLGIRLR